MTCYIKLVRLFLFSLIIIPLLLSCVTLSDKNQDLESFQDVEVMRPDPPKDIKVSDVSFFSLRLSWSAPNKIGVRVNGEKASLKYYKVEYSESPSFLNSKILTSTELNALLALKPSMSYYIRVWTVNDNGVKGKDSSQKSLLKEKVTTPTILPITPPQNFEAVSVSDLFIDLKWSEPLSKGIPNEGLKDVKLSSYVLKFFKKRAVSSSKEVVIIITPDKSSYRLAAEVSTTYEISIASKNELGKTSSFDTKIVTTKSAIQSSSGPVTALTITAKSATSDNYRVSWEPPTDFGKVNSQTEASLVSYEVYYSEAESFPENTPKVRVVVPKKEAELILTKGGTVYHIKVVVSNNTKESSTATTSRITTRNKSTASDAPVLITPTATTQSVSINWREPVNKGASPQGVSNAGVISSYKLEYTKKVTDPNFLNPEGFRVITSGGVSGGVAPKMFSFASSDLLGKTVYLFRVYAVNNFSKTSQSSNVVETITGTRVVGPQKVINLRAIPETISREVLLTWTPLTVFGTKSDGQTPAQRIDQYKYKIYATGLSTVIEESSFQGSTVTNNQKKISYTKALSNDTSYDAVLIAVNEDGGLSLESDRTSFKTVVTLETVPTSPRDITKDFSSFDKSTGSGVKISWTEPLNKGKDDSGIEKTSSDITYDIRFTKESSSTNQGDFSDSTKYSESKGVSSPYTLLSLQGSTIYYIEIVANNGNTINKQSAPATYTITSSSRATPPKKLTPTVISEKNLNDKVVMIFEWAPHPSGNYGFNPDGVTASVISTPNDAYTIRYSTVQSDLESSVTDFKAFDNSISSNNSTSKGKISFSSIDNRASIEVLGATVYYYVFTIKSSNGFDANTYGNKSSASDASAPTVFPAVSSVVATSNSGELIVTWSALASGFGKLATGTSAVASDITSYKVYYKKTTGATVYSPSGEVLSTVSPLVYTITGLEDFAEYRVYVVAKNKDSGYTITAPSEAGTGLGKTKSVASAPGVPTGLAQSTTVSPTRTTIDVMWVAPTSKGAQPNGDPNTTVNYTLQYKASSISSWAATTGVMAATFENVTTAQVTGLVPFTVYDFRVRSVNASDAGSTSNYTSSEVSIKTLIDVSAPTAFPVVSAVAETSNSGELIVTWVALASGFGKLATGTSAVASDITSYKVYYKKTTGATVYSVSSDVLSTVSPLAYTITGLEDFAEYRVYVVAKNRDSGYTPTVPSEADTAVGRTKSVASAPGVPTGLAKSTTVSPTTTTIDVMWVAPTSKGAQPNGDPNTTVNYTLQYKASSISSWAATTGVMTKELENVTTAQVTGLVPFTDYDFRVRSVNVSESSLTSNYTSSEVSIKTLIDVSAPTAFPVVSAVAETSNAGELRVSWVALASGFGKLATGTSAVASDITSYKVYYKKTTGATVYSVSSDVLSTVSPLAVTLTGLDNFADYRVYVVAKNRDSGYTPTVPPEADTAVGRTKSVVSAPGVPTGLAQSTTAPPTRTTIDVMWVAPTSKGAQPNGDPNTTVNYTLQYKASSISSWVATTGVMTMTFENVTTAQVTGLAPFTDYDFRVRSVNVSESSLTSVYTATTIIKTLSDASAPTVFPAVSSVVATSNAGELIVTWSALASGFGKLSKGNLAVASDITSYKVYYKKTTGATVYSPSGEVLSTVSPLVYTITGLEDFADYRVYVVAKNRDSGYTPTVPPEADTAVGKTKSVVSAPGVPTGLAQSTTAPPTKTTIDVMWVAPTSKGAQPNGDPNTTVNYTLQYKASSISSWAATTGVMAATFENVTTAQVTGLAPFTDYDFRVRSVNVSESSLTSVYTATTIIKTLSDASAPTVFPAVSSVVATSNAGELIVNWSALASGFGKLSKGNLAVASDITSYKVYYKKTTGATVYSVSSDVLSTVSPLAVTLTGLDNFADYRVYVVAKNRDSGYTPTVPPEADTAVGRTKSVVSAPGVPTGLAQSTKAPPTTTTIDVMWVAPTNKGAKPNGDPNTAVNYTLQYKASSVSSWAATTGVMTMTFENLTTAQVTGLAPFTDYDFRIRSVNTLDTSLFSDYTSSVVTIKTLSGATAPGAPTAITSRDVEGQTMFLSWTAPTDKGLDDKATSPSTIKEYKVTYGGITRKVKETSIFIYGLTVATSYSFTVTATNALGKESVSSASYTVSTNAVSFIAINKKILNTTGIGSKNSIGNRVNTSASSRTILSVINIYLTNNLTSAELDYVLAHENRYKWTIGYGSSKIDVNNGKKRFEMSTNWTGADVDNFKLNPGVLISNSAQDFDFRLTFSKTSKTMTVTDTSNGLNRDAGAIRAFYVRIGGSYYSDKEPPRQLSTAEITALDQKLLVSNRAGLGSTTKQGNVVNTSASPRTILSVINTYLVTGLRDSELNHILSNPAKYRWSISVGDRRDRRDDSSGTNLISRFATVTNWTGADADDMLLTPDPLTSDPFNFKLTFTRSSGTIKITDSHVTNEPNTYGGIRGMTITKVTTP